MASLRHHHQDYVLFQTNDDKSLDDDGCVVVVNKKHDGDMIDDVHDDDDSTASLAWSSTCSYDADCERSSKNDFHSMENHGGGSSSDNMLVHHLGSVSSSCTVANHDHHHHDAAVHIPAHVQVVLMTNPWFSSLPSPTMTPTAADASTTNSATLSTKASSAAAARRRRLLLRRHRQGRLGVGGGNSNKCRRFIVHCRKSTSTSFSSSSSLSFMGSQENDDTQKTEELIICTSRSSSPSVVVEQSQEWSKEQSYEHLELAVDDAEQDKDDDDSHTNETDDDDDDDGARSSSIPRHVHVTSAVLDDGEESDLEDETTSTVGHHQQHDDDAMVGTFIPATPFQVALAAFFSQFEPPTSTTRCDTSDDNDDDDSLSIDVSSEKEEVGCDNVLTHGNDEQTESSEDSSSQYPLDDDDCDTIGAQDNDTSQTETVMALAEHCHDMQQLSSKRDVFLETTTELLVGPLVGLHVGLLVVDLSDDQQKDDGNATPFESKITKADPPVVLNIIESESMTRQQSPSIHVFQGEMSDAGDNTSPAVDDESSAAQGTVGGIWSWMGRSLFSWVATSTLGIQENDDSNEDGDEDDCADNIVPFRVAEAVLDEADDLYVDMMQGHDSCPPGFNSAPPNLATGDSSSSTSSSSAPTSLLRESDDHMTDGEIRVIDHNNFHEASSLEKLFKEMGVNRWHGQWKKIRIDGSAFTVLPQPYGQCCLLWAVLNMKEPLTLILNGSYSCGTYTQLACSSLWSDQVLRTNHRHFRPLTQEMRCLAFGGFSIKSYANVSDLAYSFRRLLVWNRSLQLKTLQLGPFALTVYPPIDDKGALDPFLRLMADLKHVPKLELMGFGGGRLVGHAALGELIHSGMRGPISSTICLTGLGLDNGHCRVIANALAARPTWIEKLDLSNNPGIGDEGLDYFNTLFHITARGHFSSTFSIIVDREDWMTCLSLSFGLRHQNSFRVW